MSKRVMVLAVAASVMAAALWSGMAMAQDAAKAPPAAAGQAADQQVNVPVKRVVLFASGVGFFEHDGTVTGNVTTELPFKTAQLNDVLMSLVVSDMGGGTVNSVTYPSLDPLAKTLKSFQIDLSDSPAMHDLLGQIRGTKVTVQVNDEIITGRVIGVQDKQIAAGKDQPPVTRWQLNLLTDAGLRQVMLEDARKIEIDDPALNRELQQALNAIAQARDTDKKPVVIHFNGNGPRDVSIGYVVETPVWKTSYRLILPEKTSKDNAQLQGWAIVENQTDNDWENVDLSLVGGRPISFVMNLAQPLYAPRPEVQPKMYASIGPVTYGEGQEQAREKLALQENAGQEFAAARGVRTADALRAGSPMAAAAPMAGYANQAERQLGGGADRRADFGQGVASLAQATKLGEMFQYTVPHVTLARQRSAMLPIVTDPVQVERVSIYNQSVLARHPLHGVRLKNTTNKYLLGGPVTVLETEKGKGSVYAGDANFDDIPIGQDRLLSYGVDQELLVDTKQDNNQQMMTASIVRGVLRVQYKSQMTTTYDAQNKDDSDRTLLIENPIVGNYELIEPAKPLEKTDSVYRFQVTVPANKTGTFAVKKQWVRMESVAILPMDEATLQFYARSGAVPDKVKKVLAVAIEKKQALTVLQRRLAERNQDRQRILDDEKNIRENLKALPNDTKLRQDQITDLAAKEDDLKKATQDIKDLQQQSQDAQSDLEKYLNEMTVE